MEGPSGLWGTFVVQAAGRLLDFWWHATHDEFETGRDQVTAHWLVWLETFLVLGVALRALRGDSSFGERRGCGEGPSGGAGCALVVDFEGRTYEGHGVQVAPEEGSPLGTAVLPACNDTEGAEESPEDIEVARLPGVPPRDAIVWRGRTDTVLVRTGLRDIPQEIARLEQAAPCDPGLVPITVRGPWLGILGADEKTELDLLPPYDLSLVVEESSARRYDRTFLDIRVPSGAGKLLTREDIKKSLGEGGSIEVVVAGCDGRRFLAEEATAFAP